jgi:hypothetical protein
MRAHVRQFWPFMLFFSVLMGIGFYFLSCYDFTWEETVRLLPDALVGAVVGFVIAFFIAWIYKAAAPGTFSKVKWLYLLQMAVLGFLAFLHADGWLDDLAGILFWVAELFITAMLIVRFRKSIDSLIFHLIASVFWFFFLVFYLINIHSAFYPH